MYHHLLGVSSVCEKKNIVLRKNVRGISRILLKGMLKTRFSRFFPDFYHKNIKRGALEHSQLPLDTPLKVSRLPAKFLQKQYVLYIIAYDIADSTKNQSSCRV